MPDPSSGYWFAAIVGLLAALLAWVLPGKRPGPWLACAGGILPALLVVTIVLGAGERLGDLKLDLDELHFAAHAPFEPARTNAESARQISIGSNAVGGPEQPEPGADPADGERAAPPNPLRSDDLVVRARTSSATEFGPGFARIELTSAANPDCFGQRLCLRFDPAARARGLIAVGSNLVWAGQIERPFGGAMRYCVAGHAIGLEPAGSRLTSDGRLAAAVLPEPSERRVIMLRDFGIVDPAVPARDQPLRDVATYLVGDGIAWRLIVADPDGQIAPDGRCGTAAAARSRAVKVGLLDQTRLWFYALEPTSPEDFLNRLREPERQDTSLFGRIKAIFGFDQDPLPAARLVLRRSFDFRASADGLTVTPVTPDSLRIPYAEQARRKIAAGGSAAVSFGNLGALLQGSDVTELHFASVGARIAGQFRQILDLRNAKPDAAGCLPGLVGGTIAPQTETANEAKAASAATSGWFAGCTMYLGSASGDWAKVEQNALGFGYLPFGLALWLAPLGLLLSLGATWQLRRDDSLAFAVLLLLDFLLAMRQLVAFEAAYVDPRPSVLFSMMAATVAIWAVPPMAIAIAQPVRRGSAPLGRWQGRLVWIASLGGLALALLILGWAPASMPDKYRFLAYVGLLGPVVLGVAALVRRLHSRRNTAMQTDDLIATGAPHDRPARLRTVLIVLALLAILCLLAGFASQRMLAATLSLLLGFGFTARYFVAWSADRSLTADDPGTVGRLRGLAGNLPKAVLCLILLMLPLAFTAPAFIRQSDTGFAFLGFIALGLTWLVLWVVLRLAGQRGRAGLHWTLPVWSLVAIGLLVGLALWSPLSTFGSQAKPTAAEMAQMLDAVVDSDHFTQRRLAFSNPEMMDALGTKEGEGARSAFYQMAVYANQGSWGRGFLNQPPPTELRLAHTSDYAASVHLIAPFGRIGAALLPIVVFLAMANVAAAALRRRSLGELRTLLALGGLSLLLCGDLYMILANMLAVPFTGRNVYWLSPISISDLAEGVILVFPAIALALAATEPDAIQTAEAAA